MMILHNFFKMHVPYTLQVDKRPISLNHILEIDARGSLLLKAKQQDFNCWAENTTVNYYLLLI